ncbi:cyclic peptide export ABC transporter [Fulvivirga ulvae]|uniref:cyclic peptide export ABC transporter n=1 Tax=Fulvivirga ulvae TaxID=2904245 RepID=UPI001F283DDE|nr:cyclic peptide export ABC transporter [Fulvivirga ulvae]UII31858.1 cyclic peptide export ABC transporter [Fulvivirga ulvae]
MTLTVDAQDITGRLRVMAEEQREKAHIPGMVMIVVNKSETFVESFGYADLQAGKKVDSQSLFQLGSLSKAFTSLGVLKLVDQEKLSLDDKVSEYLPWLQFYYEDNPVSVTMRDLLHHTSGIPWETIADIPEANDENALLRTVEALKGQELRFEPGEEFEYATINYDVLALVIQTITGRAFEDFLQKEVIDPLSLQHTSIGAPNDSSEMTVGYKNSFFQPKAYNAPVYRGNNAAGYVISNADDMARWLKIQLGQEPNALSGLIARSHVADDRVAPVHLSYYAMGWEVSLRGDKRVFHHGQNPNYSSHISLLPEEGIGVAILSNSSNELMSEIAYRAIHILKGEEPDEDRVVSEGDGNDKAFSVVSIILCVYLLILLVFFGKMLLDISKGRRTFKVPGISQVLASMASVGFCIPLLIAIYLLPKALGNLNWDTINVWMPFSFGTMVTLLVSSMISSYLVFFIAQLFPEPNEVKRELPKIVLFSIITGISNMVVIFIITSSLRNVMDLEYLIFYFLIAMSIYVFGRKHVQTRIVKVTQNLIYEIRLKMISKIFSTSYQSFEKLKKGRVYATLNDDVSVVGNSTGMIVTIIRNTITIGGAFFYMATVAFWATMLTLTLIISITTFYYFVSRRAQGHLEIARDTRDEFMWQITGLVEGFKELSLHYGKKKGYNADVEKTIGDFKTKIYTAQINFINAFLIGESSLILVLGVVAIVLPNLMPGIENYVITNFVIILLYLIGPINELLSAAPSVVQLKIAWTRIQKFLLEIPANHDWQASQLTDRTAFVEELKIESLSFEYQVAADSKPFKVGPIDLTVKKGEVLFIIGGNGSGKTTFAKLLTGLYLGNSGRILVDGKEIKNIGEYYSAVFSPMYLFEKIYNVDLTDKKDEIDRYLRLLGLSDKVTIENGHFSTTKLSAGQRKRLGLLQCYLEDHPIYLFDEWAADQDPEYRNFFYKQLIPEMKRSNKIVIAITHDDHYFSVADKVLKLDTGKPSFVSNHYKVEDVLIQNLS